MAAPLNVTLNHQRQCTICLESLAVRTTVTLSCCHTFHLDCVGSAFNAGNAMRCPVCEAMEEGVWRTFPTTAPRRSRAGAHMAQNVQEPSLRMQPPSGIYWGLDQGWFSGSPSPGNGGPMRHPYSYQRRRRETAHMMMGSVYGSGEASTSSHVTRISHLRLGVNRRPNYGYSFQGNVGPNEHYEPFSHGMNSVLPVALEAPDIAFLGEPIFNNSAGNLSGRLAGVAPVGQSMNLPSPAAHAMMHSPNNRSSSRGLLPAEQTAFQAEGSRTVNIQLPDGGEVLLDLSADVPPGDGIEGSEEDTSNGEESVEDQSQ